MRLNKIQQDMEKFLDQDRHNFLTYFYSFDSGPRAFSLPPPLGLPSHSRIYVYDSSIHSIQPPALCSGPFLFIFIIQKKKGKRRRKKKPPAPMMQRWPQKRAHFQMWKPPQTPSQCKMLFLQY